MKHIALQLFESTQHSEFIQPRLFFAMPSTQKEIVLITGANVGLGLEIARKLLQDYGERFYCLIGCRTLSKGESAVKELHSQSLTGCEVIEIEVTSDDSIEKAAKIVEQKFGRLDVLHVNVSKTCIAIRHQSLLIPS